MANFYEILGVPKGASQADIKKAYRELAKVHHPDKHKGDAEAEEKFKRITEAYNALGDPEERAAYDASHKAHPRTPNAGFHRNGGGYTSYFDDRGNERRVYEDGRSEVIFNMRSRNAQNFNPLIDPRRPAPDTSEGGHPLFAGGGRRGRRARRRMRVDMHAQVPNGRGCPACGGSGAVSSFRNGRFERDRCPMCG